MSVIMTLLPLNDPLPALSFPLDTDPLMLASPEIVSEHGARSEGGPAQIHTHCRYRVRITGLAETGGAVLELFVNGEPAGVSWSQTGPVFEGVFTSPNDGRVFRDCFGYVELSVSWTTKENALPLRSGHLEVMVRNNESLNRSVEDMARYVCAHQEDLLFGGEAKSRVHWGLQKGRRTDLLGRLALLREAAGLYEASYPYFKANCRFQIQKTPTVQPLERLQYIAPATLQYAACHPEELQPAAGNAGIRAGRRVWQPRRALGLVNQASMDTYENRILLGFLKTLLEDPENYCFSVLHSVHMPHSITHIGADIHWYR